MRCYHATSIAGIRVFKPKPYWHLPDYSRTGLAVPGQARPEGWLERDLFFAAGKWMAPIFFSDKSIGKQCSPGNARSDPLLKQFGIESVSSDSVVVYDSSDREAVVHSEVIIYEFDAALFECIPSGEYVISEPVTPLLEHAPMNTLAAMVEWGYQVEFVDGLKEYSASRDVFDTDERMDDAG